MGDNIIGEVKYDEISNTDDTNAKNKNTTLSKVSFEMHLKSNGTLSFELRNHYAYDEDKYLNVLTEKEQYIVDTLNEQLIQIKT